MKRSRAVLCAALFVLVCGLTVSFLSLFTGGSSPLLGYMEWTSFEIVDEQGRARSFDPYTSEAPWGWREGETFRFTGRLPGLEEGQELYEGGGYLILECQGLDLIAYVDGAECCRVRYQDQGQPMELCQLHMPLASESAGKVLELRFVPLTAASAQYPTFARFSSEKAFYRFSYSTASDNALSAGAYALGFVFICAVFLIGLAMGNPDWTILLLAFVAFATTVLRMNELSGYYFLPVRLYRLLLDERIRLLLIALLVLYLFLNRRRSFWRYLGRVTVFAALAAAAWYAVDRLRGGTFASTVDIILQNVLEGYFYPLSYYFCIYLTTACGCITAYTLLRWTLEVWSRANALSLRNQLITEDYENIRQNVERTALMRHEWKNQVAALHVLAQKGDLEKLEKALEDMDGQLTVLSPKQYSKHFAVNILLQNAAARAEKLGVEFNATALLPSELAIEERDLCSFLLNLLDNALTAASQAPEGRRAVDLGIRLNQGYLTVKCENSYRGPLSLDEDGQLQTTKPEHTGHGLGLLQMRAVAEKYRGMFDVSYTEDRFTVSASLKLPDGQ